MLNFDPCVYCWTKQFHFSFDLLLCESKSFRKFFIITKRQMQPFKISQNVFLCSLLPFHLLAATSQDCTGWHFRGKALYYKAFLKENAVVWKLNLFSYASKHWYDYFNEIRKRLGILVWPNLTWSLSDIMKTLLLTKTFKFLKRKDVLINREMANWSFHWRGPNSFISFFCLMTVFCSAFKNSFKEAEGLWI